MRLFFIFLFSIILSIANGQTSAKKKTKIATKTTTQKPTAKAKAAKVVVIDTTPNPYYIIIDKSDYELHVYDDTGWLATYPVVFGSKDLTDKMYEGDKRTPDGAYKVMLKKIHKEWGPELLLDYPNEDNKKNFEQRKKDGKIPKGKTIGSGIAIHGTRVGSEWTVDNYINWTDGCISVRRSEMKEIYDMIRIGTKVTIQQ
jgi:murein L,D-transpeptidase YafK